MRFANRDISFEPGAFAYGQALRLNSALGVRRRAEYHGLGTHDFAR